jgi:hypothetical protein
VSPLRGRSRTERAIAIASTAVVCAALATAGIVWLPGGTNVPPGAPHAAAERIITPLYTPVPTSVYWSFFARAAPTARGAIVDICAPDGSGSGCNRKPADAAAPGWSATVQRLRHAGVVPFYYISTNYAATPVVTVEREVRDAITWYKTPDFFFDQAPTSCSRVPYYRSLYRYVHHLGGIVMLDLGAVTPSGCYMPVSDVLQIFFGTQAQFQAATFPSWLAKYPPGRFAAVLTAGTRSGVGTDINDAARDRIGNIYVNDEKKNPNFSTLPAFWQTELADVKAKARPRT